MKLKNAPHDFNTMQDAAQTILRKAWRTCQGDYPTSPELRMQAEIYLAGAQIKAQQRGLTPQTANQQKATSVALCVMCEYLIANWREATGTGKWPVPGGK